MTSARPSGGSVRLRPRYEFNRPGQSVPLLVCDADLDGSPIGRTEIWLSMTRGLRIQWRSSSLDSSISLGSSTMSVPHPELGAQQLTVSVNHNDGSGHVMNADLSTSNQVSDVITHWVNLPMILPARTLTEGSRTWAGRWSTEAAGWILTLDSRKDLSEILQLARREDEEFTITHVGELRRTGGEEFNKEEAEDVLFGWQLAMSFALGRWVTPSLPVGLDSSGRKVWERWTSWRGDTMTGYQSWWDSHTGNDLAVFVRQFLVMYLDEEQGPVLRYLAMHMIAANHSGTTGEARVMLAQAGLEYLAWVDMRLSGRMSRSQYKDLDAQQRLRVLLEDAGIPAAVPPDLDSLSQVAEEHDLDGPGVVTWVRNRLVHPKDPGEPYRLEGLVWQAAQLLLEYGELLTLHRIGYRGRFARRYPPGRWAHLAEPVPWSL